MKNIAHLSDSHLIAGKLFKGVATDKRLIQVLHDIPDNTDLLLITGDIAHYGDTLSYQLFAELLQDIHCPIAVLSGNHDNTQNMAKTLSPYLQTLCDLSPWSVYLLNSKQDGAVSGYVTNDELNKLQQTLLQHPDNFFVIALHHPIVAMESSWDDALSLSNSEDLWRLLKRHQNIKAVVWGHAHEAKFFHKQGINLYATPATAGDHQDGTIFGYRKITLYDDGKIDSDVVWMN